MKCVEFSGIGNRSMKGMATEMKYCIQADLMQRDDNLYGFSNGYIE